MAGYDRRGHVQPPKAGLWTPYLDADADFEAVNPLSPEADIVRAAGLGFPMYGAPDALTLKWVIAERVRKSGSRRRPLGRDAIQNGHTELNKKGYFALRKILFGRKAKSKAADWVTIRSYSNVPWEHVEKLNALPVEEVVWHYRRMRAATAHLAPQGEAPEQQILKAG